MTTLRESIETYILAKDGNRPHLMAQAFAGDARLEMIVETDDISFPSQVEGLEAIARVLVSQFAQRYENIYTFCIADPPAAQQRFDCNWLVCMSEKDSGLARAGFGRYAWHCADASAKVSALRITIAEMAVYPRESSAPILAWAQRLPYPWCPREQLLRCPPDIAAIQRIVAALANAPSLDAEAPE